MRDVGVYGCGRVLSTVIWLQPQTRYTRMGPRERIGNPLKMPVGRDPWDGNTGLTFNPLYNPVFPMPQPSISIGWGRGEGI